MDSIVKAERFKDLRGLSYRNRLKEISRMVNARYLIIGKISVSKDLTISDSSRKIFNIGDGPLVMYGIKIIMIDADAGKNISEAKCLSNDKHMDISRRMVLKKTLPKYIAEEFPDLINELISGASDNL